MPIAFIHNFVLNELIDIPQIRTSIAVPWFGRNCTLLTSVDLVIMQPTSAGSTLQIQLPPGTSAGTVYAQGAAHYFTTIGRRDNLQLSNGLAITLR